MIVWYGGYQILCSVFFFQAEDGIRDLTVTGVQTCALPISLFARQYVRHRQRRPLGLGCRQRSAARRGKWQLRSRASDSPGLIRDPWRISIPRDRRFDLCRWRRYSQPTVWRRATRGGDTSRDVDSPLPASSRTNGTL